MNTGKILLGTIAGLAAGAVLGILFAPAKGTETREKILHKGEDYVDGLKAKYNDLRETISDKLESLTESEEAARTKAHQLKQGFKVKTS